MARADAGICGGRIIIDSESDYPIPNSSNEKQSDSGTNSISMAYGYFCFANVLPILSGYDKVSKDPPPTPASSAPPTTQTNNSKKNIGKTPQTVQQQEGSITISNQSHDPLSEDLSNPITAGLVQLSVLVNMSWISLQLYDPISAFQHSKSAITVAQTLSQNMVKQSNHPTISSIRQQHLRYLFLAQVYHAESAIHLGQTTSAVNTLSSFLKSFDSGEYNDSATDEPNPRSQAGRMSDAKSSLYTNLSIVHIIKGDYSDAQKCVTAVLSQNATFSPAILVQVYLYLVNNNTKAALERLIHPTFYPVSFGRAKPNKFM